MGAVSAFTAGNYHCKPLMTDVIVTHMTDVTVKHCNPKYINICSLRKVEVLCAILPNEGKLEDVTGCKFLYFTLCKIQNFCSW